MVTSPHRLAAPLAAVVALTCLAYPAAAGRSAAAPARTAAGATVDRTIKEPKVVESSGLARSTHRKRVLWTHNDKGGDPSLFAIGGRGNTRAVLSLSGAESVDWEDVASGPRHKLWVADIGDNDATRKHVSVYRIREPRALEDRDIVSTRFDFVYPGGSRNAEGLMVNPRTGRLFIVSKDSDGGAIYRAPKALRTDRVNKLERLTSAPPNITGAAFGPDGDHFVLCSYSTIYRYKAFGAAPRRFDKPDLDQGESIAVNLSGRAVFVGSEGSNSPVYRVRTR